VSAEQPGLVAPEDGSRDAAGDEHATDSQQTSFGFAPSPVATPASIGATPADALPYDDEPPRATGLKRLTRRERRQLGRLRARKVSRVVRRIDPWSVLLISLGFYLCLFAVLMVAGLLLWVIASLTGTIHQIEGTVKDLFAEKSFHFDGLKIFRASFLGGLIMVIAGSGLNVLLCTLFNLISDLVGGVRVTVIEEETARPSR